MLIPEFVILILINPLVSVDELEVEEPMDGDGEIEAGESTVMSLIPSLLLIFDTSPCRFQSLFGSANLS